MNVIRYLGSLSHLSSGGPFSCEQVIQRQAGTASLSPATESTHVAALRLPLLKDDAILALPLILNFQSRFEISVAPEVSDGAKPGANPKVRHSLFSASVPPSMSTAGNTKTTWSSTTDDVAAATAGPSFPTFWLVLDTKAIFVIPVYPQSNLSVLHTTN